MKSSGSIAALAKSLVKVQGIIEPAVKSSENPFLKSKYAGLESIWEASRKVLTDNGLSVTQLGADDGTSDVVIETVLIHESGEWISGTMRFKPTKADPQQAGSAITYAKRYGLSAILGITTEGEDDDGHHASQPSSPKPKTDRTLKEQPEEMHEITFDELLIKLKDIDNLPQLQNTQAKYQPWVRANFSTSEKSTLAGIIREKTQELTGGN